MAGRAIHGTKVSWGPMPRPTATDVGWVVAVAKASVDVEAERQSNLGDQAQSHEQWPRHDGIGVADRRSDRRLSPTDHERRDAEEVDPAADVEVELHHVEVEQPDSGHEAQRGSAPASNVTALAPPSVSNRDP